MEDRTIELPKPNNMEELKERLAALAMFANQIGLQGYTAKAVQFKVQGFTDMIEVNLLVQKRLTEKPSE